MTIVSKEFVLTRAQAARILTFYFLSKTIWFNVLLALGGLVLLVLQGGPIPLFMLIFAVAWPFVMYVRNFTLMSRGEGKVYGVPRRMRFDSDGVAIVLSDREIWSKWTDFSRIVPTWGGMLLFLKTRKFVILPAAAFEPSELAELYGFLRGAGLLRRF